MARFPLPTLTIATIAALATALLALAEAVRQRRHAARMVAATDARWRSLIVNAADVVVVLAGDGTIQYASPAAKRLFGYDSDESTGLQVLDLIHPDDLGFVAERFGLALDRPGPGELIEFRVRRHDGGFAWVESIGTNLLAEPAVNGIVCNVRDITDRKAAEETLRHQARHDALTGLPNRTSLAEVLAAKADASSADPAGEGMHALLLLDLNRFKEINDGLGHDVGDRVLLEVASRLSLGTRPGDIVTRLGGDEFAVVVGGLRSAGDACSVAAHMLSVLEEALILDDMVLHLRGSIGIAVSTLHGPSPTALLQKADVAMYRAKEQGLGWAVFGPEDDDNRPGRLGMVADLRRALDDGDLEVHFQPQVELTTGQILQVEALARWTRAGREVTPSVFIPLAEQTGLIGPLTELVLTRALAQCRRWASEGIAVSVAVNVSPATIRDPRFVQTVAAALALAGVPAQHLTLEITESALAEQTAGVIAVMARLRELGVRLSIDDFGSGYSSMAYLKGLPIDELKIDKAFVVDVLADPRDRHIIEAITALGHSLGLSVVAEGVESAEAGNVLRLLGCDHAQGFHFGRPAPGADCTGVLARSARTAARA